MKAPNASDINRMRTQAIVAPRTMRRQAVRGITSLPAGKSVPIAAMPVFREDAVKSGRIRFQFEQMETAEILMNAINVRTMAYFVPKLALERFNGSMDQLNLSYEGLPPLTGEDVVPWFEMQAFGAHGGNELFVGMGRHGAPARMANTDYIESYNLIQNMRRKNRSPDLPLRTRLQTDLAEAFWAHEQFRHMVPDFDQAIIDGEVPLNVVNAMMPVKGLGVLNGNYPFASTSVAESDGGTVVYPNAKALYDSADNNAVFLKGSAATAGIPQVFAELQDNGITVSLSNIEMARKTQAFAEIRRAYNMHEDHVINLLMDAISIPEQAFKQPMLLADKTTIFGQSKRYASDSGNLTESVVNGMTVIEMSLQLPRVNMGGVIMVVAEITPDQLFERQEDPFLFASSVDDLPQYLRDTLDPEKVDVVKNSRIDTSHSTPDGTFAYEPMNARWNIEAPFCGGKFYRPTVDASFDEDRQRIWAVETEDPTLSTDFYLCTTMHTKPFVGTNQDPFEVVAQGDVFIEGNTVFGGHLVEATNDYEEVLAVAPQARIEKE